VYPPIFKEVPEIQINGDNYLMSYQPTFTKGDKKMFKRKLFVMALILSLLSSLLVVGVASAHNAGCILLPDGTYLSVGSGKEAHEVPEANPNRNDLGQLDLIEDPGFDTRDQYGARYAADQGNTPILPGECP
jgi:hypothetical protein